jgi:hypothetical protein
MASRIAPLAVHTKVLIRYRVPLSGHSKALGMFFLHNKHIGITAQHNGEQPQGTC